MFLNLRAKLAICKKALKLMPYLSSLKKNEVWLFTQESELEVLTSKIDRDHDLSQLLQTEIAESRNLLARYGCWVAREVELVVQKGIVLGLISDPLIELK